LIPTMYALLTFAVGLVAGADLASHEDGDALSLLQMSSAKVSMHFEKDDKECKAATKAHKSVKKQAKIDKKAAKEARAAWKTAQQAMKDSKEAEAAALAKVAAECPLPEVDNSPDVGCSDILFTSLTPAVSQTKAPLLLERGLPGFTNWLGFNEVLPGGGAPIGDFPNGDGGGKMIPKSTKEERNIGIAVMKPCSVAWTVGMFRYPHTQVDQKTGKMRPGYFQQNNNVQPNEQIFMKKEGINTAQECRAWADTVMKWPEAAAVQFSHYGHGGQCHVFSMTKIPFKSDGFSLTLVNSAHTDFTCYLGNPEEWKQRLAAEKAAGQTVDKCSKAGVWANGNWELNGNRTSRGTVGNIPIGKLSWPNPLGNTEAGRKSCYKWAKADPKCADAVALELVSDTCYCNPTTNSIRRNAPRQDPPSANQVCMFQ